MTNTSKSLTLSRLIFNNPVLIALYFLPFLRPDFINTISYLPTVFDALLYFSVFVGAVLFFTNRSKFPKIVLAVFCYFAIIILSTVIKHGSLNSAIVNTIKPVLFVMGIYYGQKTNMNNLFNTLEFVLCTIIIINFITIIAFPQGMYLKEAEYSYSRENWFIGFKNVHIRTILPGVVLTMVNGYRKYHKITIMSYIMIGIMILSSILVNSSTAIVGSVIFVLLLLIFRLRRLYSFFDIRKIIIFLIISFLAVFLFNAQNMFSFLIEGILGKDLTLSNRVFLWQNAVKQIIKHPIIGIGIQHSDYMYTVIGASHTHDYLLYILLTGGLVGAYFIGYAYFLVGKKLTRTKNSVVSKIYLAMLISFLVMGLTESLTSTTLLYPFLILSFYPELFDPLLSEANNVTGTG